MSAYHPEPYWNAVAKRISHRDKFDLIEGEREPYYRYKRKKAIGLLEKIDFQDKVVLEVGSGPGANLYEISKHHPKQLYGVDISDEMINISKKVLENIPVNVTKIDGRHIPYRDGHFDLSLTSTVLQHNTNEQMLSDLVDEICRVTKDEIYIFEKIEKKLTGTELCMGRPINYYKILFQKNNFALVDVQFINIQISYLVSGTIRKLFNKRSNKEGEEISKISRLLQKLTLPVTSRLDNAFKTQRELALLHFKKS
jgi:ubiquinone/menaquinone biosynthesis C-methylase UbiE